MSNKRRYLNMVVTGLFIAAAFTFRSKLNSSGFNKELWKYLDPFLSPFILISSFLIFLGILILKNRNKIRDLDNLSTKDMIYVAFLLWTFVLLGFLSIYSIIKNGTI